MTDFITLLKEETGPSRQALENYIEDHLREYGGLDPYFKSFLQKVTAYVNEGGKWLRPYLALQASKQQDKSIESKELYLSVAILEVFHRYLLIYDDLIDQDLLRHGKPTLEKVFSEEALATSQINDLAMYGKGMAMIAADILHSLLYQLIENLRVEERVKQNLRLALHTCLMETAAGWRLETILKRLALRDTDLKKVTKAMTLVSTQYTFLWPLRWGQLVVGGEYGKWREELEIYAQHLGQAFQLKDDVLGIFGEPERTGKPVGNDLREGKKSYLIVLTYSLANDREKAILEAAIGQEPTQENLELIQNIMKNTGALEQVEKLIQTHIEAGIKVLGGDEENLHLRELAGFLAERAH